MNPILPNHQSPVITDPREGSFYLIPSFVPPEFPSVLIFLLFTVFLVRYDQIHSAILKSFAKGIEICRFIIYQPFHFFTWAASSFTRKRRGTINRFLNQRDFSRRVQVVSQRNFLAACHHHPLRTLSRFDFSDAAPPFLAGAKLPSAKDFAQSNCPFASSSERKDLHAFNQALFSFHSSRRLQQVEGDGYCSGKSFQRAPTGSTHKIPSKQRWLETRPRPFPCSGSSRNGAIFSHCLSVNSLFNFLQSGSPPF